MKTTMAVLTAMTMLAMALAPVGSADTFATDDCSSPPANTQCKTAFGPLGATDKFLGGVGLFVCSDDSDPTDPTSALPIGCSVAGGGGVNFNTSSWTGASVDALVWVEWIGGGLTMPDGNLEGFEVVACSDRNDDSVCTNGAQPEPTATDPGRVVFDDYETGYSSGATITGDEVADKDSKGTDSTTAAVPICVHPDELGLNSADADYDDVTVFIGAISDASGLDFSGEEPEYTGNHQFHASSGFFEVWLQNSGLTC